MAGGYGFNTGQKTQRPETRPAKQKPRGTAREEESQWVKDLNNVKLLLSTEPGGSMPVSSAEVPHLSSRSVSKLPFRSKQIKHMLRLRPEKQSETQVDGEMEVRNVARRKATDGRLFYQILDPSAAGSTYQVNRRGDDSVNQHLFGKSHQWKTSELPNAAPSPRKKRRSRKALSASNFLGLPPPSFNVTNFEEDIPHLTSKKTKSRHSRQISPSKLNAVQLPKFARFRGKPESALQSKMPLQSEDLEKTGFTQDPTLHLDSAPQGASSNFAASASQPVSPMKRSSGPQLTARGRPNLSLTPIKSDKRPQGADPHPMQVTPEFSVVPSSEIWSPGEPSDQSHWRSTGTRATSDTSKATSSAIPSSQSNEIPRHRTSDCPTPAPTGPLPPLPEGEGLPNGRWSKPLVIASDNMPTPDVSPQKKSSPIRPGTGPRSQGQRLDVFPQSNSSHDIPPTASEVNWPTTTAPITALPFRPRSQKVSGPQHFGPNALGDPFQHRINKTKAIKQRDVRHNKAHTENHKAQSAIFVNDISPGSERASTEQEMPPEGHAGIANHAGSSADAPAGDGEPVRDITVQPVNGSGRGNRLSPIMTVAELAPSKALGGPPLPPPQAQPCTLPRTIYRSHSTQISPYRFNAQAGRGSSSVYTDITGPSTAAAPPPPPPAFGPPPLPQVKSPSSAPTDAPNGVPISSVPVQSVTTPSASPRRPATGRRPAQAQHPERELSPTANDGQTGSEGGVAPMGELESRVEARLRAFERKTVLLETALLAVINASAGLVRVGSGGGRVEVNIGQQVELARS